MSIFIILPEKQELYHEKKLYPTDKNNNFKKANCIKLQTDYIISSIQPIIPRVFIKNIIALGILFCSAASILPMQKPVRRLTPQIGKILTGGQKRQMTEYIPFITEAAKNLPDLSELAQQISNIPEIVKVAFAVIIPYGINQRILSITETNSWVAKLHGLEKEYYDTQNKITYTKIDNTPSQVQILQKSKINTEEWAMAALVTSATTVLTTGAWAGVAIVTDPTNVGDCVTAFYTGQAAASALTLSAYLNLGNEKRTLANLILTKKVKEEKETEIKMMIEKAISENNNKQNYEHGGLGNRIDCLKQLILDEKATKIKNATLDQPDQAKTSELNK
ncbi:hypothetical protein KBC04_04360 [Candidatus Babeliales bacterium]|nr:hypothetical protein [Candidatus Babeliales bacterium]MBP9844299.1 hypothetical protein [Candidatus Babeliales bacterium]